MKWWVFRWADPLFGRDGGPHYFGIYWRGFQFGRWESPASYARRLKQRAYLLQGSSEVPSKREPPQFGPGMALPERDSAFSTAIRTTEKLVQDMQRERAEREAADVEAERVMPATEAAKRGVML